MSEFNSRVERQKLLLEAEEWAKGVKCLHTHRLSSMWYDTRPEDTIDSHVTDTEFNDGLIIRHKNNKLIHTFGVAIKGEELINAYCRGGL